MSVSTRNAYQALGDLFLPAGISVSFDLDTDNIIVCGQKYGFVVTGAWCRDHADTVVRDVEMMLPDLFKAEFGQVEMVPTERLLRRDARSS